MPVKPHYAVSFVIPDAKTDHMVEKCLTFLMPVFPGPKRLGHLLA